MTCLSTSKSNMSYAYLVVEQTCIDDIPKSIKIPSTPMCKSEISLSTDFTSLKFLKTVKALTSPLKTASRRGWAMSCAAESTSIPTKNFISGWPLITCFNSFYSISQPFNNTQWKFHKFQKGETFQLVPITNYYFTH